MPLILENALVEYIKSAFVDLAANGLMLPWIYLGYNAEFGGTQGSPPGSTPSAAQPPSQSVNETMDKTKKPSISINSSKIGGFGGDLLGTSTNVNKS